MNRNLAGAEDDLTTEELLEVIDQLGQAKVFNLSIFGGEPLAHPDFFLIIEHLNKYPIKLSLNTNGTLIDQPRAKWLKAHKIKRAIVSFDGSKPEIMDGVRGTGAFKRNIKGIEALLKEGLSVLLSVTLTKINYQDVREMVLLGRKIEATGIRFNHVFFGGNAACFIDEIYLSPNEEREAIDAVWRANQEFSQFIESSSTYLGQKQKLEEMKNYKPVTDKIIIPPCGAAGDKCAIRPDGWVTPCEMLWEVKCGNLKEQRLTDIWQNSFMMNQFRKPLELDLNEIPECKNCQCQYLCFIGHRCSPYYYPQGVKDRSLYCWLNKSRGELINAHK